MKKKIIITLVVLLPLLLIGYVVRNLYELQLTDEILVGQLSMEDPVVLAPETHFHQSDPPISGECLLSVFHRFKTTSQTPQSLVITDETGKIVQNIKWASDDRSYIANLYPIQQATGTFHLAWYWNNQLIAENEITIDKK
ncbi:MAG: hypothetical protein ACXVC1_02905 [Tumebacillaceae bacterium]